MSRKQIYEKTNDVTDGNGALLQSTKTAVFVNKSSESFGMFTTTDGLDWAVPLRGVLLLLMYFTNLSDQKTGYISLSTKRRKDIVTFFGWSNQRSLGFMLADAIKLNGLSRINNSKNDFMLNPEHFFSGSTADKAEKVNNYNLIRNGK
jgi:hypothetical protein